MTASNSETTGICERLRAVREQAFGVRGRAAFARALGLSPSTYIYYEKGRVPPPEVLARAAEVAAVRLEWLVTGQEPRDVSAAEVRRERESHLPADLGAALQRFAEQSPSGAPSPAATNALGEILAQVAERFPPRRATAWQESNVERTEGMIPVLGRTAAGLVGSYTELLGEEPATTVAEIAERALGLDVRTQAAAEVGADEPPLDRSAETPAESVSLVQLSAPLGSGVVEFVDAATVRRAHPNAFAMRVDGESMAPRFRHGDVVIALAGATVGQGQPALVQIRGRVGVTLKLVRREGETVHLVPINEAYDAERLPTSEVEWLAPVLLAARFPSGR